MMSENSFVVYTGNNPVTDPVEGVETRKFREYYANVLRPEFA